jgi:hypothetical protein
VASRCEGPTIRIVVIIISAATARATNKRLRHVRASMRSGADRKLGEHDGDLIAEQRLGTWQNDTSLGQHLLDLGKMPWAIISRTRMPEGRTSGIKNTAPRHGGTGGSNPACSSTESGANFTQVRFRVRADEPTARTPASLHRTP